MFQLPALDLMVNKLYFYSRQYELSYNCSPWSQKPTTSKRRLTKEFFLYPCGRYTSNEQNATDTRPGCVELPNGLRSTCTGIRYQIYMGRYWGKKTMGIKECKRYPHLLFDSSNLIYFVWHWCYMKGIAIYRIETSVILLHQYYSCLLVKYGAHSSCI